MSLVVQISEAVDKFLDYQQVRKGRTRDTINTYRSILGQFVAYTGNISIDELTVELIDKYADTLGRYAPKTLRNKLTPIRSLISYLYSKDIVSIRKESIDLPTVNEIEANFLDEDEQRRLLDACKNIRERALIQFLIASGLRVTELINVRTDDLYARSVVVRRGKGGKPRTSYITEESDSLIKDYHATFGHDSYWLFPAEDGTQLSRQYVHRLIVMIARRAGLTKKVSPHTLRHTFGTNLLMRGARIEDVQQMMGHQNIRTTQIYMHFTNTYLKGRYDEVMLKPVPAY